MRASPAAAPVRVSVSKIDSRYEGVMCGQSGGGVEGDGGAGVGGQWCPSRDARAGTSSHSAGSE